MWVITVDPLLAAGGLLLLALFVAVWAYRLDRGVPFRPVVSLAGAVTCLAAFFLVEGGGWFAVEATAPLDLFLLGAAVVAGAVYTDTTTRILRYPDGRAGYRTRAAVPVAWFLLVCATAVAEVHFLGQLDVLGVISLQGVPDPLVALGVGISAPNALVLTLIGAALALSTGVLLGQTAGVGSRLVRHRWAFRRGRRPSRSGVRPGSARPPLPTGRSVDGRPT